MSAGSRTSFAPGLDPHDPAMEAIDHVDVVVTSLERSLPIYAGLLGEIGVVDAGEIVGERGERVVCLSSRGAPGAVGLRERLSGSGSHDRCALGLHHLAFRRRRRESWGR